MSIIGDSLPREPDPQKFANHPEVKKLLQEGWKFGNGPSQEEIKEFFPEQTASDSNIGCVILFIIGILFMIIVGTS